MKIFSVGRGANNLIEPTRDEYKCAIMKYKELENKYKFPQIELQSILCKTNDPKLTLEEKYSISNSLNISNLGFLSLSPWAYDNFGNPKPEYIIGDLKMNKLSEIFNSDSFNDLYKRLI